MAMNPDFTKLNLEEHPHCSYDEWKAELEKTTGKNYDALYENNNGTYSCRSALRQRCV